MFAHRKKQLEKHLNDLTEILGKKQPEKMAGIIWPEKMAGKNEMKCFYI